MKTLFNSFKYATRVSGGKIKALLRAYEISKKDGLSGISQALNFISRNNSGQLIRRAGYKSLAEFPWVLEEVARACSIDPAVSKEPYLKRLKKPVYFQYGDKVSLAFEKCAHELKPFQDFGIIKLTNRYDEGSLLPLLNSKGIENWVLISDRDVVVKNFQNKSQKKIIDNKKLNLSSREVSKLTFHVASSLGAKELVIVSNEKEDVILRGFISLLKLYTSVTIEEAK